jgi:hypothetical protein
MQVSLPSQKGLSVGERDCEGNGRVSVFRVGGGLRNLAEAEMKLIRVTTAAAKVKMNEKRIKRAQFHLALYPDMLSMVRDEAAKDGRTVTGWIEKAIAEKLEGAGRQWIQ